ncbi:MAG: hypothetical protein WDM81_19425 [Rhizomicrobium sp.]
MSKSHLSCALAFLILLPLAAQAQVETVVVTGSRIHDEDEAPHLSITKRADHVITEVSVTCDTRELSQRRSELKETLRNMIRAAGGTLDDLARHRKQDRAGFERVEFRFDHRARRPGRHEPRRRHHQDQGLEGRYLQRCHRRSPDFIASVPKAGRTEVLRQGSWGLTIVGPEQYRDAIVAQIVADARHTADLFGPGNAVQVEGLEHQVAWYQKVRSTWGFIFPTR